MSHVEIPSYQYVSTVDLHEVCGIIFGGNQVDETLQDLGSPVPAWAIGCAGIGLAGLATGGTGITIAVAICGGGTIGCAIEGIIEESTPCGNVQTEIHVAQNLATTNPEAIVVPKCETGYLAASVEDVIQTADGYADEAVEIGEDLADDVSGGVDAAVETGEDIAGDLADGAGDVIDEGGDIIDDATNSFNLF